MPYGMDIYSGGGKPFPENVYRRVFVSVVCCMADRALPFSDGKILYKRVLIPTT